MKAALCLEQNQPLSVEEVTPLDPGPGDVIVRIAASGVCHSDLSVINGTLPAGRVVLGHEGAGVVVKVDADLPDEQLALIGCGVTTGVGAALNTARVQPGSIVAVIGCGGVGQAVIQGARIAGAARIIAIDPVALKREHAMQHGATDVVDPTDADPVEAVRALSGGRGADYSFEVIGNAAIVRQAL